MLDVIEAMIGEIYLNDCVARPDSCAANPSCSVHRVWLQAREQLRQTLGAVSFADLLRDECCSPCPAPAHDKAYPAASQPGAE
jgi:DNA-binding IscR family transcriptional regulator